MEPMLDPRLLKENVDGEAIEWAASRLTAQGKKQNRIILVSDGAPVDDMTLYTNEGDILVRHLLQTVDEINLRAGWKIGGIGVGYDCREYYASSVWFGDLSIDTGKLRHFLSQLLSIPASSVADEA
jgi:cobaltochelatase CobT